MRCEEFNKKIKEYDLDTFGNTKECPGCNQECNVYESNLCCDIKIVYCDVCDTVEDFTPSKISGINVCPYCFNLVKFNDEDKDNYVQCDDKDCHQKAHLNCAIDLMCSSCKTWICQEHGEKSGTVTCDYCLLPHSIDCIVGRESELENFVGTLCMPCFSRLSGLMNTIKKPAVSNQRILDSINTNKFFYLTEAAENIDLSIIVTHLIRSDINTLDILIKILKEECLRANTTGYYKHISDIKSVCFADLTIRGLHRHSKKYSQYGLGFLKEIVYEKGGAPALYVREDILKKNNKELPEEIKPFVNKLELKTHDFHHEREWRVPGDFQFERNEVSVVFAPLEHHRRIRLEFPEIDQIFDLDFLQLI